MGAFNDQHPTGIGIGLTNDKCLPNGEVADRFFFHCCCYRKAGSEIWAGAMAFFSSKSKELELCNYEINFATDDRGVYLKLDEGYEVREGDAIITHRLHFIPSEKQASEIQGLIWNVDGLLDVATDPKNMTFEIPMNHSLRQLVRTAIVERARPESSRSGIFRTR